MAKILSKSEYRLSDIICFQNVELTRAFLIEQDSISKKSYFRIDLESRISVDRVMSFLDIQHVEVVLKNGPNKSFRLRHFFSNLVFMATQHRDLKAIKIFLQQFAKWNILGEETNMVIEQEVFFKADKKAIQILLQFGIDKLFSNDMSAALFGNPNVKVEYFKRKKKFNMYMRGTNDSTALHYATKSQSFKKVKYLLDRGAKPNSTTSKEVTPLNLALCERYVNEIENEKCAELLLQYGADPLLLTSDWELQNFFISAESFDPPDVEPVSIGHLSKLVLAYCMYKAIGTKEISLKIGNHYRGPDNLLIFYRKCQQELKTLKKHQIRENVTMFTILCETGLKLIRLPNKEDCRVITSVIDKYDKEMTLNRYYLNALRENMRQVRKLVAHKNRAMRDIPRSIKYPMPFIVLEKIISYLTYEDSLMYQ